MPGPGAFEQRRHGYQQPQQTSPQYSMTGLDIIDIFDFPFNSVDGRSYIESLDRDSKGTDSWHVLGTTVYHCQAYTHEDQQMSVALRLTLMRDAIRALVYISQSQRSQRPMVSAGPHQGDHKDFDMRHREEAMRHTQMDKPYIAVPQGNAHASPYAAAPATKILNVDSMNVLRHLLTEANAIGRPPLPIPADLAGCRVGRKTAWYNAIFDCPGLKLPRLHEIAALSGRRYSAKLIVSPEDCNYIMYPLGSIEYATLYPEGPGARVVLYHLSSMTDAFRYITTILSTLGT